jgi:hypothetical protein
VIHAVEGAHHGAAAAVCHAMTDHSQLEHRLPVMLLLLLFTWLLLLLLLLWLVSTTKPLACTSPNQHKRTHEFMACCSKALPCHSKAQAC